MDGELSTIITLCCSLISLSISLLAFVKTETSEKVFWKDFHKNIREAIGSELGIIDRRLNRIEHYIHSEKKNEA